MPGRDFQILEHVAKSGTPMGLLGDPRVGGGAPLTEAQAALRFFEVNWTTRETFARGAASSGRRALLVSWRTNARRGLTTPWRSTRFVLPRAWRRMARAAVFRR